MSFLARRCVGRAFPSVPHPAGVVGAYERSAPQAMRMAWHFGEGPAEPHNGEYHWMTVQGLPNRGWNPWFNWLTEPFDSFDENLFLRWDEPANLFYLELEISHLNPDMSVDHAWWRSVNYASFAWNAGVSVAMNFDFWEGHARRVMDPILFVEVGTYQLLPPHSCPP